MTTAVEQLTLIFKQAAALGVKRRVITTGGSQEPDQIIAQAGAAANGIEPHHVLRAVVPRQVADPARARSFIAAWTRRGYPFAG